MSSYDAVIVGAGPYGLSAAAHLNRISGLDVKVFGRPMSFWSEQMPTGMFLRSPYVASFLSDPDRSLTLDDYQAAKATNFEAPVPLSRFIDYGLWFQGHAVPDVDTRRVEQIEAGSQGFRLALEDGEQISARRVVIATGILPFAHKPELFRSLPDSLVSHTAAHSSFDKFKGKEVIVVGGGQSAIESAALMNESGAKVEIFIREPVLRWLWKTKWVHSPWFSWMFFAPADVGPAFLSHLVARPDLFRRLPREHQDRWAKRAIRAAASAWVRPRVHNIIPIHTSKSIDGARTVGDRICLRLNDGSERTVDHVLLGTGFKIDISRYSFLCPDLLARIDRIDGYPRLDNCFATSLPGLHFLGATAAWSFGPLARFVVGADFACRKLARRISRATKP